MNLIEFHTGLVGTRKEQHKEGKPPEEFYTYNCPFCGEEGNRFFYFPSNTHWDCKKCGREGNSYGFLQQFYNEVLKKTHNLRNIWRLPERVFVNVRHNPFLDCPVIPTFREGKLNNLYKVDIRRKQVSNGEWIDKAVVLGTPGMKATLLDWPSTSYSTVWLTEGQKDKFAGDAIVGSQEVEVVGCPGANMFQDSWAFGFVDKDIVICFDNDGPGREGTRKIVEIFKNSPYKPRSIRCLDWPEECEEGFDLYDYFEYNGGRTYHEVNTHLKEIVEEDITETAVSNIVADESITTYEKLMNVFKATYHTTNDMETVISIILASIYSTNLDGEQVWVKVIGRPGCGKTTVAKGLSASEYVQSLSTFTGLFSGWKDGQEGDPSLVPLIKNRTLIVKDADALLQQGNIEKIMSELRDFYDKSSTVFYGNRMHYSYENVRSTFIMMGTQALRNSDQSFLGERLLSIEMDVTQKEADLIKQRVAENEIKKALGEQTGTDEAVQAAFKGFIQHLKDRDTEGVEIPDEFKQYVIRLATLAANMRTTVHRDRRRKVLSPPQPELPTRLIGQIISASVSLCVVYNIEEPDDRVKRIVRKITRDTMSPRSHRWAICEIIHEKPGVTAKEVQETTGFPMGLINDELDDLLELDFLTITSMKQGNGLYTPSLRLTYHINEGFNEVI